MGPSGIASGADVFRWLLSEKCFSDSAEEKMSTVLVSQDCAKVQ